MIRVTTFSLAFLLSVVGIAHAEWSLTTADAPVQTHLTVNTWDSSGGLSVTNPSGNLVKVDSRSVVSLTSDSKAGATGNSWRLTLRNGDTLLGQPAGISGQSLNFALPELGTIGVPLKLAVSLAAPSSPVGFVANAGGDKDIVHLNNGDTMEGIIAGIEAEKVQLATGNEVGNAAATDIAMGLVQRINFAGVNPPRTLPPLSARITFISGTVLTVPLDAAQQAFTWSINDLTLNDPAGGKHKVSADKVQSIEVLGGRVISLTELDPVKEEQTTFMGTRWPTGINKTTLDHSLSISGIAYARGLGVHTRSLLAYDLDGSFETLRVRVGMDDSAAPRGEADVSVILDGKVLWQKASMGTGAGQLSDEILLPIKGGKHLELHADPPKNRGGLDVLGRVDWLAPVVIRP